MEELTVDPRFRDALPNLTLEEARTLEKNIVEDGEIREAIVVWGDTGIILDGHNRYKIAKKRGLCFKTVKMDFANADDAVRWIIDHQIGKRNLSGAAISTVRAKRAALIDDDKKASAILGVSDRQLRTDKKVAEAIESLPEDKREAVKNTASQVDLVTFHALPEEEKEQVVARLGTQTLAEALPKKRHKLDDEHFHLVKSHFDTNCLQRVVAGAEITPAQVKYICTCPAVRRQLIFDLVSANDMSFAEAIDKAKRLSPKKPTDTSLEMTKAAERVEDLTAKLVNALDLYAELAGILEQGEYKWIRSQVEGISPSLAKIQNKPSGDLTTTRQKAMKTAQALLRCVDDVNRDKPEAKKHHNALTKTKEVLEELKEW